MAVFTPPPLLSFDPVARGFQNAQQGAANFLANQKLMAQLPFVSQNLAQELQKRIYDNMIKQVEAQVAPEMQQAELGYKQSQIPYLQANTAHQQLMNQFLPQKIQSELTSKQAQTEKNRMMLQNPLLNMSGVAGQIGAGDYLKNIGRPDLAEKIYKNMDAQERNLKLKEWLSAPAAVRNKYIAEAAGLGFSIPESIEYGITKTPFKELAKIKGYNDIEKHPELAPLPIYPPTGASLTANQKRNQGVAELNVINKHVTEALAPYSVQFKGYSPKQVWQAIKGKNIDEQARALAARMLAPELAGARSRVSGGAMGIEAIREMTHKAMLGLKVPEWSVSPEVFAKAQEYADSWITEGASAANKIALSPELANQMYQDNVISNTALEKENAEKIYTYNPKTGKIE